MSEYRTIHVLLVEDDQVDVMAVERAFQKHKILNPITTAKDGVEALEILRGQGRPPIPQPVVILLDLNLPRMNGIEFLRELRADPKLRKTVVFVLTTSKDDEDKARAYDRHVAGYIVKSNVGPAFLGVAEMLQAYWKVVELP